jgi:two-component system response regulator (stage 0 sporulation protein F)
MGKKRVLIVDDQLDIRRLFRDSVRLLGGDIEIVDVPSGEEAMLVIARQRFDLLISDVRLAGMSGLELVRKVRQRNPGLKVILVTGLTDSEIRQQVSAAGAEAFFFKPVDIATLQSAVKDCLKPESTTAPVGAVEPEAENLGSSASHPTEATRLELGADYVFVADVEGVIYQRSGSIPGDLDEADLLSPAVAVMQTAKNLAKKFHGEVAKRTLIPLGSGYHLHLVTAGDSQFLVALVRSTERGSAQESVELVANRIPEQPLVPNTHSGDSYLAESQDDTPMSDADLSELDSAINKANKTNTSELDAYWETAADQTQSDGLSAGAISYDQARRLGIAPAEDST